MKTSPIISADEYVKRFVKACEKAGMIADILEPSTRIRVQTPDADSRMAEIITLRPDGHNRLCWWWSWDEPICLADDIDTAVRKIRYVTAP